MNLADLHLPQYEVPDGYDADSYLEQLVLAGLERRCCEALAAGRQLEPELYRERAFRELGVIRQLGHANYFLVVAEYVGWARSQGIPVGPGRGAVAGSLSAWAMGITRKPSITASSARSGLTSVTTTLPPIPWARIASPRPHQP